MMERRKLTKEDIEKVRDIEGFPIGTDEDIITLSEVPYYTACPNPFIEDFIKEYGTPYDEATDDYHCEPFAADVSEGKNDPIYMAHTYHTKVPYKAIMRYILHYTKPGDVVFDGFCGTGMTGVAAMMCGVADRGLKQQLCYDMQERVEFGTRYSILNDLSPAATFISNNYTVFTDPQALKKQFEKALLLTDEEYGWMYETQHVIYNKGKTLFAPGKGKINYIIWSDVFICSNCGHEIIFWNEAVDIKKGKIRSTFACPFCHADFGKASNERAVEIVYDTSLKKSVTLSKQVPVLINYTYNGKRYIKEPDDNDIKLIKRINEIDVPYWHPIAALPEGYNTEQPKRTNGIYYVHQFYTKRNLLFLSKFYSLLGDDNKLRFIFTSVLQNASKMYKYRTDGKGGIVTGTLYVPALSQENNVHNLLSTKAEMIYKSCVDYAEGKCIISTNSSTKEMMPESSIDYIFVDPPFGANINYSELSFLWEAWLKVVTNNQKEAICNDIQGKGLLEYHNLMTNCFREFYRVLKPNRWMTVEFHNSKNAVWNSIQEALQSAGFIIADVRTLDKKQGSFKQVTTTSAVKQDLVISAYKPTVRFEKSILEKVGTEATAWSFVRQHLSKLPVVVYNKEGEIEILSERRAFLLFDRMIAYHIIHGIPVPIDATDFYKGLEKKFLERDGMYFLVDQVNEYDIARIKNSIEPIQFSLFVTNEKNAIAWLYQQLSEPQTYAELQHKFMERARTVDRYEAIPELAVLLEENFIQDEKGRWYIPDITKEGDLIKLREKRLWQEFEGYMNSRGKLNLFRSEAIRVGFSRLWKDKNYRAIVNIAERLPEQTIQEDPNLLMYYDISLSRV